MLTMVAVFGPLFFAPGPDSCLSHETALKAAAHELWLGYNQRDTSLLARVLDDRLLLVPATGGVMTKPELLAHLSTPPEALRSRSDETLEEMRTAFANHSAMLSFRRRWRVTHEPTGVSFDATS